MDDTVRMTNEAGDIATVERRAFERVWAARGWRDASAATDIASSEPGDAASAFDETRPTDLGQEPPIAQASEQDLEPSKES